MNKWKLFCAMGEKGYRQKSLAAAIGISKNSFSHKMNGKSSFRLDEVDKICGILGIEKPEDKGAIFLNGRSQ